MACVIGIDIGTTSTIGILIDLPGRIVAIASRPVDLISRHPGWAEEDPGQWWQNTCEIIRELLAAEPNITLAGIGVAGMVPALVLLDSNGAPLRLSIQQSDGRCAPQVEQLAAELDAATFLARTGNGINQQLIAAKLRWLALHEPEIFRKIATVFGSYDFINYKLTGARRIEHNWALEAGFEGPVMFDAPRAGEFVVYEVVAAEDGGDFAENFGFMQGQPAEFGGDELLVDTVAGAGQEGGGVQLGGELFNLRGAAAVTLLDAEAKRRAV